MFLGTYAPKLDDKGRIILPAKFWAELDPGLVVPRGQERCLYVFSTKGFEELHERIRQAPITDKASRDFLRVFLSGASAEVPDGQHRFTIPAHLRSYAGLDRDLTVIGTGNHAEIWDTASWETYYSEHESGYSDISEEVIPGLF